MKRGTPEHIKTERLMDRLGVDLAKACGTLELLWHVAGKFARRGDIGAKLSDEEIAKRVAWSGSPDDLIAALVEAGWLDRHSVHRLVIHDWHDHADDATKKAIERAGLTFASLDVENCLAAVGKSPPALAMPSLAKPSPATAARGGGIEGQKRTDGEASEIVLALEAENISASRASKAVEAHGVQGATTILDYFRAERAKGWMRDPKAVLTAFLKNPEEKDFTRDDAGNLVPPSQRPAESAKAETKGAKARRKFGGMAQ